MLPDVLAPGDLAVISCSCSLFEKSHKSIVSLQIPPWFSPFREHPWGLLHALPPSPALPQRGGLVLPNPRASSPATAAYCRGFLTQWRVSPRRCAHLCYSGGGDRGSSLNTPGLSSTSLLDHTHAQAAWIQGSGQPLTYETQSVSPDLLRCSRGNKAGSISNRFLSL